MAPSDQRDQNDPTRTDGGDGGPVLVAFPEAADGELPERYEIRTLEDGFRVLRCQEAPGVTVSVDRGHVYSEADARRLGERVVLVDGAGAFAPTVDGTRQLYNLDHHEGCARMFTLASCEQALVTVLKGIPLDRGDWTVYANEPDLDTVLALWVLLNHRRIPQLSPESRDVMAPLLRLEGAIDANGPEVATLCGLTTETLEVTRERLDALMAPETEARSQGEWSSLDPLDHVLDRLRAVDRLVYSEADFTEYEQVDEVYTHVPLGSDWVAVVCRDTEGIYAVEEKLKDLWGERLGVIALEKEPGVWTLKRTASLAGFDMQRAYRRLNLVDPAVDGRPREKRWGGSDEIGGSPRGAVSSLEPKQIGTALERTFERRKPWAWLRSAGVAIGLTALLAVALLLVTPFEGREPLSPLATAGQWAILGAVAAIGATLLSSWRSAGRLWIFGFRLPAGRSWLGLTLPVALAAALAGRWAVPWGEIPEGSGAVAAASLGALVLWAMGLELWFRGFVHGCLVLELPTQHTGGRWLLSGPILLSTLLWTLFHLLAWWLGIFATTLPFDTLGNGLTVGLGSCLAGLGLGFLRERSLSLWIGPTILAAAWLLALFFAPWQLLVDAFPGLVGS